MSKARNGDGSLRQDQRGKWIVEISIWSGPNGKRKRTRRTFNDKDTAKKALPVGYFHPERVRHGDRVGVHEHLRDAHGVQFG